MVFAWLAAEACIFSILEQMRLESLRGLWPRVRVGGRKVNRSYLKESGNAVRLSLYRLPREY